MINTYATLENYGIEEGTSNTDILRKLIDTCNALESSNNLLEKQMKESEKRCDSLIFEYMAVYSKLTVKRKMIQEIKAEFTQLKTTSENELLLMRQKMLTEIAELKIALYDEKLAKLERSKIIAFRTA